MYTYELPISEVISLSPAAAAIRLLLEGKEFHFQPGQYVQVELELKESEHFKLHERYLKIQKRTFSLSSSPNEKKYLEFTIKSIKEGFISTYFVKHLKKGDKIKIRGPMGNFIFSEGETRPNILFLAAGSGISPLMSMLRYITEKKIKVNIDLLYSNKTEEEILWKKEIEARAKENKHMKHLFTLTQQNWSGRIGRIDREIIQQHIKEKENTDFYICGTRSFVRAMEAILHELQVNESQIKKEIF